MSQSYVIKVSASVRETVDAKDKKTKTLVLTEIVPPSEQKEILQEKLKEKGWDEVEGSDGTKYQKRRGRVTEVIDLETMTVEASVEIERTLERNRTITVRGDRDLESVEDRRTKEKDALQKSIAITEDERADAQTGMQREIAKVLEETEAERNQELNEIVREVYGESLKRKAGRMGTITEVSESQSGQDYELVIKLTE